MLDGEPLAEERREYINGEVYAMAEEVFNAVDRLNNRPRKCLNYKMPYEVFEELTRINMRKSEDYALMT